MEEPYGVKSKYVSHEKTTQTIFKFDVKKSILVYYDYFLEDLVEPNYYGNRFIALPEKPGVTFDYSYCDEKSMMNLLDKRMQQYESVLKQVALKNKEWKMGKDFE